MRRPNPLISIVIPAYNESIHIARTLQIIAGEAAKITDSFELIVVDDGSRDGTWAALTAFAASEPRLFALRLSRNFGKELALCAGLEQAAGKAIVVMDADLQHPPALLPEMVRIWQEQRVDIVEGIKLDRGRESWRKKWGSSLFYWMLNRLSGFQLQGASDYKLLDRKVVEAWKRLPERETFFRGMIAWLGFSKAELEFEVPSRAGGTSRWGIMALTRLAVRAIVSFSAIPLRFVSIIGLLFLLGAFVLGVQTLYQKIAGNAVTGFTTVIILLLVIGSVLMISLGVIGEYIASIYQEMKQRPRYLVGETVGGDESGKVGGYQ